MKISYRYYECGPSPDGHLQCDKDGNAVCATDFYGPSCNIHCVVSPGLNMECDKNGTVVCKDNYFGGNCTTFCDPPVHGFCDINGTAHCNENYYGENCDNICFTPGNGTGYCDLNGTLICNLGICLHKMYQYSSSYSAFTKGIQNLLIYTMTIHGIFNFKHYISLLCVL